MDLTLLCAASGMGKTTFLRDQVSRLAAQGRTVGGVVSPAVFEQGRRVGYDLLDLRSDDRRPLARVDGADALSVGRYRFVEAALRAGNDAIVQAAGDGLDIIVIDEVGPLEMRGEGWTPAIEFVLQARHPGQQLIMTVRPTLADKLPARFPASAWAAETRVVPPWPENLEA
jgi:nucleoside-triphosphatase THEP1